MAGAKAGAKLYWLIETAKGTDIEPLRYLQNIVTELAKTGPLEGVESLLSFELKPAYDCVALGQTDRLLKYQQDAQIKYTC